MRWGVELADCSRYGGGAVADHGGDAGVDAGEAGQGTGSAKREGIGY